MVSPSPRPVPRSEDQLTVRLFDPVAPPADVAETQPRAAAAGRVPADEGGRYVLLEAVGQGGMGTVYRGLDLHLDRELAVKVLHAQHQSEAEFRRHFEQEARIVGRLQHPGIVPVYDLGRLSSGQLFFSMKFVEGLTLAAILQQRPDPAQDRATLLKTFESLCLTLAFAHSKGVVHRDLKPSNVMVGAFGEVQVMDWGLAKVINDPGSGFPTATVAKQHTGSTTLSFGGDIVGTPAYMAPEQARGEPSLDARADVFGLGAILCHVLTGGPPFPSPEVKRRRVAMLYHWYRAQRLPLSAEAFGRLPRNPAFRYDYADGAGHLSPQPKTLNALLDLAAFPVPPWAAGREMIRPLAASDWAAFPGVFAAAFACTQPFASLNDEDCLAAAAACLDQTRTGGDGPLIPPACFTAEAGGRVVGGILITLIPRREPGRVWDGLWVQPPPSDAVARGLGRAHLTWVFVAPGYASRGLGTALLTRAVAALRDLGHVDLASTFLIGNDASILWHWRNGFRLMPSPG